MRRQDEETGAYYEGYEPLYARYQRVISLLEDSKMEKMKEEIFGKQVVALPNPDLAAFRRAKELNIPISQWESWDIHDQAFYIAGSMLDNMEQTLRRYDEIKERNLKKLSDGK